MLCSSLTEPHLRIHKNPPCRVSSAQVTLRVSGAQVSSSSQRHIFSTPILSRIGELFDKNRPLVIQLRDPNPSGDMRHELPAHFSMNFWNHRANQLLPLIGRNVQVADVALLLIDLYLAFSSAAAVKAKGFGTRWGCFVLQRSLLDCHRLLNLPLLSLVLLHGLLLHTRLLFTLRPQGNF